MAKQISLRVECSVDPWATYVIEHAWPRWLAYFIFWLIPVDWYIRTEVIEE